MSVEQMLQRYANREIEATEHETVDDMGGYGLLRGIRDRAYALELRKKDDTVLAIPYALIEQFLYSPTDGITLRASGREYRICGKHLNTSTTQGLSLYVGITRHRVTWIAERARSHAIGTSCTIVETLSWL